MLHYEITGAAVPGALEIRFSALSASKYKE